MDAGVAYFPTHDAVPPGELARLVEARGHRWLMFAEHTHIPASRETPWSGREGAPPLPRKYAHTYDLFVAMAMPLAATSRAAGRSGICLVTERDPIITAKEVASLDHLSGGRVDFGVGAGWNREEMVNHGTNPRTRMRLMRERVLAIKAIWANDEATFHGDFVSFDRIWSRPEAAAACRTRRSTSAAAARPCSTACSSTATRGCRTTATRDAARIAELRERAGRRVPVVVMGVPADPAELERLAAAGVDRVLFWLPSARLAVVETSWTRSRARWTRSPAARSSSRLRYQFGEVVGGGTSASACATSTLGAGVRDVLGERLAELVVEPVDGLRAHPEATRRARRSPAWRGRRRRTPRPPAAGRSAASRSRRRRRSPR